MADVIVEVVKWALILIGLCCVFGVLEMWLWPPK